MGADRTTLCADPTADARAGCRSVLAGAATSVWAATSPELADIGGVYCEDCAISADVAPYVVDPAAAQRLWTLSEALSGLPIS